jgi:signal transduction histidine kinase
LVPADPGELEMTLTASERMSQEARVEVVTRRLTRLAFDVHDGPMQNLIAVGYGLGDLRLRLQPLLTEREGAAVSGVIGELVSELAEVESGLRRLMGALEERGTAAASVHEAIEVEAERFRRRCPAALELRIDPAVGAGLTTESQRIALLRVLGEALTNVAKHAAAENVLVSLSTEGEAIRLEVVDDGKGFDAGRSHQGRMGMTAMRKRMELLDGELRVSSRPGGPTSVTATLQRWEPPA